MFIPAGYAQINHYFIGNGAPRGAQVTYGVARDDLTQTAAQVAQDAHEQFALNIMPALSSSVALSKTRAKFGPNETGPFAEYSNPVAGGDASDAITPQASVLLKKNTALGGRKNSGRMFLPGLNEENVTSDGVLGASVVTGFNTRFAELIGDLLAQDLQIVLLHNDPLDDPTPITSITCQPLMATQRRRIRKVGGRRRTGDE